MGVFMGLASSKSCGTSYFLGKCDSWALTKGIRNRPVFMSVGPMLVYKLLMLTFSSSASEMAVSCIHTL